MTKSELFKLMTEYGILSEEKLLEAHAAGDVETIIFHNLRYAYTAARRESRKYEVLSEDEEIEGMLYALTLAANKWDPSKGKITTYIAQWMKAVIQDMRNSSANQIQKNTMNIWKTSVITKFIKDFEETHDRTPSIDEIADQLRTSSGKKFAKKTIYNQYFLSIKSSNSLNEPSPNNQDGDLLGETISDPDELTPFEAIAEQDLNTVVKQLVLNLSPVEQEVINRRFYKKDSYKDIAIDLQINYFDAKKIEINALSKIKKELALIEVKH